MGTSPGAAPRSSSHPGCRCRQGEAPGAHECQIPGVGKRCLGVRDWGCHRALTTLPQPCPSRYLVEAAVGQAVVLLVLRPHVGGCEAVAFPIDVFPKAQGCHLGSIIAALRSPAPNPYWIPGLYTSWLGAMEGCPVWGKTWDFCKTQTSPVSLLRHLGTYCSDAKVTKLLLLNFKV